MVPAPLLEAIGIPVGFGADFVSVVVGDFVLFFAAFVVPGFCAVQEVSTVGACFGAECHLGRAAGIVLLILTDRAGSAGVVRRYGRGGGGKNPGLIHLEMLAWMVHR